MSRIQSETSSIGANLSRLDVGLRTLQVRRENEIASYSRIMDSDVASDAAEMTKVEILQKLGASILAQANLQPQMALKLIRGD